MNFTSLVYAARSCRRFDASAPVSEETLSWLVDCARVAPSAANKQMLRYITVSSKPSCEAIFAGLSWAGALKDWPGPVPDERPTGYIIMIVEKGKKDSLTLIDTGIAAQTMQLAAHSKGLSQCMFLSFNPDVMQEAASIPAGYEVALVIAVGVPVEIRTVAAVSESGSVLYYRDADGVHYVPKRDLSTVLLHHV